MILPVDNINIELKNFTKKDFDKVVSKMHTDFSSQKIKNRDIIYNGFSCAISLSPKANASDLWHHVIYRTYTKELKERYPQKDLGQSWRRASGDAFEMFLVHYYNLMFKSTSLRLVILNKNESRQALKEMRISGQVGNSKLDIAIIKDYNGNSKKPVRLNEGKLIGGIHAKASLAERVSDDVPTSDKMMHNGFLSYLFTLDVKSFPPSDTAAELRAYVNKGELGTPDNPTEKRKYIEKHGSFDACFSFNSRTIPSKKDTDSGKKIYTLQPNGEKDAFYKLLMDNV